MRSRHTSTARLTCMLIVFGLAGALAGASRASATTVTLDPEQDAWVDQVLAQQNTNHGTDATVYVHSGGGLVRRRTLVQFDLLEVPSCATVSSAQLELRIIDAPASSRTHDLHALSFDWTEDDVTWLSRDGVNPWSLGGGDFNATLTDDAATGTVDGATISWDVTADVVAFLADPSANHGWLIKDHSEGSASTTSYQARENVSGPTLVVTFTTNDAACDDDNACTTDTCDAEAGCLYAPNAGPCDDGLFCNGSDTCDDGDCAIHGGNPCTGPDGDTDCAESCDENADACTAADPDGSLCRDAAGSCDIAETCSAGSCPADAVEPVGTVCNAGSGDSCDPDETCDGLTTACPADVVQPLGTVCRIGSGDLCDPDEVCPGVPTGTCAADAIAPAGTVCNAGSGDLCDPDETCSGVATAPCPADDFASSSTECRAAADDCDAAEACPGVPNQACPTDAKEPAGTECRAAADACDAAEVCDGSSDACPSDETEPDGTSCEDGLYCNGAETCEGGVCTDQENPCVFTCDESADVCAPDGCPAGPQPECRTAAKSLLLVKQKTDETKDKLIWKFIKGDATTFDELGDPRDETHYTLCLYAGAAETLAATIHVAPNAAKWSVLGNNKGYKYFDSASASDGVQKMLVKGSASNKTKALIKGRGAALPTILGPMGLETPILAQLLNHETGVCWQGTFATAKKNTASLFKAKQ